VLSRRQFLAAAGGAVGATASGALLGGHVWPLLNKEDLIPGRAPEAQLEPEAWVSTPDRCSGGSSRIRATASAYGGISSASARRGGTSTDPTLRAGSDVRSARR
jgi:hypothetical protein